MRRDLNHARYLLEIAHSKFDELRTKRADVAEINTEISTAVPTEALKLLNRKNQ
ncbi:hypothetical protein [Mesorhizobium sp. M0678]|uniref:hypothetical protein n=1 Tax=Mesorhizobium sp. M0678 TaxID=2956985 RepID=UPI003338D102